MSTKRSIHKVKPLLSLTGAILLLFLSSSVATRAQVIDFEGLNGVPVFNQYAAQGVTFNGPMGTDFSAFGPGFAHSGTGGVQLCFAQEFCSAPLTINFTTGQSRAKLWIGYIAAISPAQMVRLQALDSGGAVLEQVTVMLGPSTSQIPINIPMEITTPTPRIRQLVLRFDAGPGVTTFNNGLLIDDVEFSTTGPAPPCPTSIRPSLSVIQPQLILPSGPTVQINEFMLQGAVATSAQLDEATLIVTKPDTSVNTFNLLNSTISSTGGTFGPTRMDGFLAEGQNSVAVRVKNCAGTTTVSRQVRYSPIPANVKIKFLGIEVTQATQDLQNSVPLVATKPTLVRVYLSLEGSALPIEGISGGLTATRPGGSVLTPLLRSINQIAVDSSTNLAAKRLSMAQSLNFMLPPSWTATSTLHLKISKLYLQGHEIKLPALGPDGFPAVSPCNGCENLDAIGAPSYVVFRSTKPLNLVLAPYIYERSATGTPELLFTPMGALQWVNNAYPVGGSFPGPSGIRILRYLPMRSTSRDLSFGSGDGASFLDELQDVLDCLHESEDLASDTRLLAMTPFGQGGLAKRPGKVAYVDTWASENGPVPQANFGGYGELWAHEMGHNFGRKHLSNSHNEETPVDLGSSFPHGGIGPPGVAISTNQWLIASPSIINPGTPASGSMHAHDFMSYGSVRSPAGEHTLTWVSPYTYKALFEKFEELGSARIVQSPKIEKLVVAGRIDPDNDVTLRPFRTVTTRYASGDGAVGDYSVVLLDGNGRTLVTYRFDPAEIENSASMAFSEFVPWNLKTRTIEIRHGKRTIAKRTVSANKPRVRVTSPTARDEWNGKATVSWVASDDDKDELTVSVLYNSGTDSTWIPIANGEKGNSVTIDTTLLPGSTRAQVRVRVTDGVNTTEADSAIFTVKEKLPQVAILNPIAGQVYPTDMMPSLTAAAYDPEDGMLPVGSLRWTSDRDGILRQTDCESLKSLSPGRHTITVTAQDSAGNIVTSSVRITIGSERPIHRQPHTTER